MKKRYVVLPLAVIVCLGLLFQVWKSSFNHVDVFAVKHQALLEEFLTLAREEAATAPEGSVLSAIYTRYGDKVLVSCFYPSSSNQYGDIRPVVSSELCSAWQDIQKKGHFTSVGCSFEPDGAMEAHFSVEGNWHPYAEGNYMVCHCLIWRDADYPVSYLASLEPMTEVEGMSPSSEGNWYWTSHKHYDG